MDNNIMNKAVEHLLRSIHVGSSINKLVKINGNQLTISGHVFEISNDSPLFITGFGKASAQMAEALWELLPEHIREYTDGMIITKYDHGVDLPGIQCREASHPVPDENCLIHTKELMHTVSSLGSNVNCIVLLSGGASALLCAPVAPITLEEKMDVTRLLLGCGASIEEMNAVRKHLSNVKGGRLGKLLPDNSLALVISDVIGDDLQSIGSGPVAWDETTYAEVMEIITKYSLADKFPASVMKVITEGCAGKREETPSMDDCNIPHVFAGNLSHALDAVESFFCNEQIEVCRQDVPLTGLHHYEVNREISLLGGLLEKHSEPFCALFGGETTVKLKPDAGKGGRVMYFGLELARALYNATNRKFIVCSVATDGTDGPTDAAGVIIEREWINTADLDSLDAALENQSLYDYLDAQNLLIKSGPTGTNVNDVHMVLFL